MSNVKDLNNYTKEDYNAEPVYYCTHCLSLKIRSTDSQMYCDVCGHTDIEQTSINDWLDLQAKSK